MNPVIPPHPRPLQAFWRALTRFDRKKISLWMGLRNALGIVLPLAVGVDLGYPGAGLVAATGALNVAAADGVDSYRNRRRTHADLEPDRRNRRILSVLSPRATVSP